MAEQADDAAAIVDGLTAATPPTESGTIHAPTLILWGAHDNLLPRGDQETLAARIAGAALKVYPDVAHLVLGVPGASR